MAIWDWMQLFMNRAEGQKLTNLVLQGLNILWLWNWQLQPCLPRCLLWGIRCHAVGFLLYQRAHSSPFGTQKTLPAALLLHNNHPVQFQLNSIIMRIVSWEQLGYLGFLLCAQGTFCSRPRGITMIESTQIRWFWRWSGRGGWSGGAVAQQRPRVSKLGLKGPSNCHSNETAVEAARWGARGLLS
jgi:hypothetical protein